ncbi:MAG: NAD(P)H-dependent oxidoreductase [Treponema sp.]|nr:NAD(P)H-dependent oxidoreductase [Treponema sp.]
MKKIAVINGSPKAKDSVSTLLVDQVKNILETELTVYQATKLKSQDDISAELAQIIQSDVLLFVFPLYVDSLPAPLIKILGSLEHAAKTRGGLLPKVYAVCNCGFYEAEHTRIALEIIGNFCIRTGFRWGYGLGIGMGGILLSVGKNMSRGPAANVYSALAELCKSIQDNIADNSSGAHNVFITPNFPRFLYSLGGNVSWRQMAKKYDAQKSLGARPHISG